MPWHSMVLLAPCTIAAAPVFAVAPTRQRDRIAITIASLMWLLGGLAWVRSL